MAHYFSYDNLVHKHKIYAIEVFNEKKELLGYRPIVDRWDAKKGGTVETISNSYHALKWKVFSTEKICIDYAIDFFININA